MSVAVRLPVVARLPMVARLQGSRAGLAITLTVALTATMSPLALTAARADSPTPRLLPGVSQDKPIRLIASRTPVRDASSRVWRPDATYATGGRLVHSINGVAGTANQVLYQRERLGVTGYRIPVDAPGTYFVNLFTSELRGALPGRRVWDVTAEGHTVASHVDVAHSVGQDRAWHVMFTSRVTDGALNLHFPRHIGVPVIGAVQVDYQSANLVKRTLFRDEFKGRPGSAPSPLRWGYDVGGNGWGNNEQQSYTSAKRNVSLDGRGHLVITARKETYTGTDEITRPYTSARIKTAGRFSFRYGHAIARINVPRGRGLWPAFWALGDNVRSVGWPLCGEIDVVETLGSQPRVVHAVVHAAQSGGGHWLAGAPLRRPNPVAGTFHDYGMVWGPSGIAMSIDGITYMTIAAADLGPQDFWNFTHPFHLLLNLAVGGNWPGAPNRRTPFPAFMLVDSVRVTN